MRFKSGDLVEFKSAGAYDHALALILGPYTGALLKRTPDSEIYDAFWIIGWGLSGAVREYDYYPELSDFYHVISEAE